MKENKRFRNHISIVAEQIFGGFFAVILILAVQLFQEADEISKADLSVLFDKSGFILLGVIALLIIITANRFLVWAKTYISIEENAIVIERNTVNKKKNTIGIKNISNINTEQNLFEMLMGTCKIKIDTNSRSTADQTDVKIVLKKADAKAFQKEVSMRMKGLEEEEGNEDTEKEAFDIQASFGDIMRHGLYSINIFSVILVIAGFAGTAFTAVRMLAQPDPLGALFRFAAADLVIISTILSGIWDTAKDFIRYYDFRAKREKDRIYLCYGLVKKVEYTIPTDKIQALIIRQSLVARIFGRYKAEIVNIGMGDDKEEQNAFLVLYGTKDQLKEQIGLLLPEFEETLEQEAARMPKSVWAAWMIPMAIYTVCICAAGAVISTLIPQYMPWIWGCTAGLIGAAFLGMLLKFMAEGVNVGDRFLKISHGYFGRKFIAVRYEKIQSLELKQNIAARALGIQKGQISLLASASDTSKHIPYFRQELAKCLREAVLHPAKADQKKSFSC